VRDRHRRVAGELRNASDIAGRDEIGAGQRDIGELAVAQGRGELRLQQIVSAGRAAAQMPFRHIDDREPGGREQCLGLAVDPLAVLQRAGGVICDAQFGNVA